MWNGIELKFFLCIKVHDSNGDVCKAKVDFWSDGNWNFFQLIEQQNSGIYCISFYKLHFQRVKNKISIKKIVIYKYLYYLGTVFKYQKFREALKSAKKEQEIM